MPKHSQKKRRGEGNDFLKILDIVFVAIASFVPTAFLPQEQVTLSWPKLTQETINVLRTGWTFLDERDYIQLLTEHDQSYKKAVEMFTWCMCYRKILNHLPSKTANKCMKHCKRYVAAYAKLQEHVGEWPVAHQALVGCLGDFPPHLRTDSSCEWVERLLLTLWWKEKWKEKWMGTSKTSTSLNRTTLASLRTKLSNNICGGYCSYWEDYNFTEICPKDTVDKFNTVCRENT